MYAIITDRRFSGWLHHCVSNVVVISAPSRFAASNIRKSRRRNTSASRSPFVSLKLMFGIISALLAKRIAEKKEKVAAIKASHKKCVFSCLNKSSTAWLISNFQGCVTAGSCSGVSLVLFFFSSLGCGAIYTCPVSLPLCFPDLFPYKWPQGYRHMVCAWGDHTWMAHPFDVLM